MNIIHILCFGIIFCVSDSLTPRNDDVIRELDPDLEELCSAYWNWKITDMPQFATFVGIHDYDAFMDDMSEAAYDNRYDKCQHFLSRAYELEPTLSNDTDIVNLKVLIYELETYINFYDLKGIYLPLNYLEGIHIDIENLFGWMVLDTYHDYEVMIQRMQAIPLQIDQIIDLMKAGVQSDIVYHDISMKNMNASIGRFTDEDPTMSPLYTYFSGNFPPQLSAEEISNLQSRATAVISQQVTPAYEKLLEYVTEEYVTRDDIAVTSIYRGEEFYNSLIQFHTSTNMSAEEIQNLGFEEVDRIEGEMMEVIREMGYENMTIHEFSNMIRDDPNNYYNTSEELLTGFEDIVYNLVPPRLPLIFKNIPEAELEVVGVTNPDGTGAYYLGGAYDGSRPGVFYVNVYDPFTQPKYSMLTLSLHEGNPGHHLQGSHSIESPDFPYFRRVTDDRNYGISPSRFPIYTFYLEGWALYSEGLGFDMDLYGDPLDRYGHYSEEIFRACRLVVDTGMHAFGWTRDEAVEYMFDHTASSRAEIENEIDRYITWPGQALAYKIGQLKISQLRLYAEEELGEDFDIKDFHDVILDSMGPLDLVEEEVLKWIDQISSSDYQFIELL